MKTKTSHTPGPWEYYEDKKDRFQISAENALVALVFEREDAEANAALIAAAPEMLEMLNENASAWDGEEHSVRLEHRDLIARLKRLIKKTEAQS